SVSGQLFFFNETATTEIYTLSLHDALPIFQDTVCVCVCVFDYTCVCVCQRRSEEHTSELQSHLTLVCRLLLEKKNVRANVTTRLRRSSNVSSLCWPSRSV